MTTAELDRFSPLLLARITGTLGLVGIVTGAFDLGYVHGSLFVDGNAAATVQNILAHETMFRLGFAGHLVLLLCNIPGEIIAFVLLRRVNFILAAVSMTCGLVGTAIEALDMLNVYAPLSIAANGQALGAFNAAQLQAMAYLSVQLQDAGLLISFVFYGLDEMLAGYVVFRSGFLPRIVGLLLGVAGACYFVNGFSFFLAPSVHVRLVPYILFPCLPGEGLYNIWLAVFGLNVVKWRAWMAGPPSRSMAPVAPVI